jgi:hypothetical protein
MAYEKTRGFSPAELERDPAGRAGVVWHKATDTPISVDPNTYKLVTGLVDNRITGEVLPQPKFGLDGNKEEVPVEATDEHEDETVIESDDTETTSHTIKRVPKTHKA